MFRRPPSCAYQYQCPACANLTSLVLLAFGLVCIMWGAARIRTVISRCEHDIRTVQDALTDAEAATQVDTSEIDHSIGKTKALADEKRAEIGTAMTAGMSHCLSRALNMYLILPPRNVSRFVIILPSLELVLRHFKFRSRVMPILSHQPRTLRQSPTSRLARSPSTPNTNRTW
jgi:hypothetical protein